MAEQESLSLFAAHLDQARELRFGFDAFGDHRLVERAPQREYRAHDLLPVVVGAEARDEGAIDLDHVDRQFVEHAERRIPGAEIVDADLHAEIAQGVEVRPRDLELLDQDALGQLDDQLGRLDLRRHDRALNAGRKVGLHELHAGYVDVHGERLGPRARRCAQCPSWRHAFSSTQLPRGMMRPVSSATRMNCAGGIGTFLRVRPAGEHLESRQAPRVELEDGLVDEVEPLLRHGVPQLALEPELCGHFGVQGAVEDRVSALALRLGAIHRDIGIAHHLVVRLVGQRAGRDADARTGRYGNPFQVQRFGEHLLQALGEHDDLAVGAHVLDENRELVAAEPRDQVLGAQKRPHAPGELDQQGVPRAVAEAVVDQLEPVEVEEQHAEAAIAVPPHGRDRAGELFDEVVAIREVGEVVVVRDVLQPGFGPPPCGDVLQLQDEAVRQRGLRGEDRAVERDPDVEPPAVRAPQLGGERRLVAVQDTVHLAPQRRLVVRMKHLPDIDAGELALRATQHARERCVGLDDAAIRRDKDHADRRVRESALEAVFAFAQLVQVPRALGGGALRRGDALGPDARLVFRMPEIDVNRGEHHGDDRRRGEDHRDFEPAERRVQQAGHRGASRIPDGEPPMVAEDPQRLHGFAALQLDERRHQQRAGREIGERHEKQQREQHADVRCLGRQMRARDLEGGAAAVHRQRRHCGAAEAARPAIRRAPGNGARLGGCGDRRRRRPVVEQQQEDEDLRDRAGCLRARDARRKQPGQRRERDAEQDLHLRRRLERSDPCDGKAQHGEAGKRRDPPVGFRLPGVVVHAQKRRCDHRRWRWASARERRGKPPIPTSQANRAPCPRIGTWRAARAFAAKTGRRRPRYVTTARRSRRLRPMR